MEMNAARLRMARVPDGATLIDNPVSAAPGFTLGNVHVMAGVPSDLRGDAGRRAADADRRAADVVPIAARRAWRRGHRGALGDLATAHPEVSIGSYPFQRDGVHGSNVVVRSQDGAAVDTGHGRAWSRLFPEAG
jgi:molybdopterin-biosynthesis enzyme MoeA-like protein